MILSSDKLHEKRTIEVLQHLRNVNVSEKCKYFTLYIGGENGRPSFFTFGKPTEQNQTLGLGFGEFEIIMLSEGADSLTLWKFAKVYNDTSTITTIFPASGILDMYAIYQQNEQSLLPLEDACPSHLTFQVGSSAQFERKVIAERDEHGILQHTEKGLIPIPVWKRKQKSRRVERTSNNKRN